MKRRRRSGLAVHEEFQKASGVLTLSEQGVDAMTEKKARDRVMAKYLACLSLMNVGRPTQRE